MNFQEIKQKIESTQSFKEFKEKNKEAYLYSGFFIIPINSSEGPQIKLDYFIPTAGSDASVASFDLNEGYSIQEPTIKDKDKKIEALGEVSLSVEEVQDIALAQIIGKDIKHEINKIIAVVQSINNESTWILSCFLSSLMMVKMYINDSSKEVSKFELINLMSFMRMK